MNLLDIGRVLWRGRRFIGAAGLIFALAGLVYGQRIAIPRYSATTTVVLKQAPAPIADMKKLVAVISTEATSLNTELHVMRSRGLIEQLIDLHHLDQDPEFNPALRPSGVLSMAGLRRALGGTPLIRTDSTVALPHEAEREIIIRNVSDAVDARVKRNTLLISLTFTSVDQQKAAVLSNALAQIYIEDQIKTKFSAVEEAVRWLSERVSVLEGELKQREELAAELRSRMSVSSSEALSVKNARLQDARRRLEQIAQSQKLAEANLAQYLASKNAGNVEQMAVLLAADDFRETHATGVEPLGLLAVEAKFQLAEDSAREEIRRLDLQQASLSTAVTKLERDVELHAAEFAKLQQVTREAEATRVIYETFLARLKETSIQRGLQNADSRILSSESLGSYDTPHTSLIVALSLLAGMTLGSGVVLGRQYVRSGFRTAEELEQATELSVLGQIPEISLTNLDQLVPFLSRSPTSPVAEAVRNLRTSVLMSDMDSPPKVIMVTSSVPDEGKTTQAIALAQNLSGLSKKVLLVDGDIRRRNLSRVFAKDGKPGLTSLLSGQRELSEVVSHLPDLGLDILHAESAHRNAADIFSSRQFGDLIDQLRDSYDFIVVDTPPVLVVPDARVIARHVDATLYAVAWNTTKRSQVVEGVRQFSLVNLPVAGMILSKIDPDGMARYGYDEAHAAYSDFGNDYYDT